MAIPEDIKNSAGVDKWTVDTKNLNVNEIRSEYMSIHMKGPSLCFSPNNMKIEFDTNCKL
jgi:hypothetical protein